MDNLLCFHKRERKNRKKVEGEKEIAEREAGR